MAIKSRQHFMAFFSAQSHKYLLPNLLPYTTTRLRDIAFAETLDYYIIQFIFSTHLSKVFPWVNIIPKKKFSELYPFLINVDWENKILVSSLSNTVCVEKPYLKPFWALFFFVYVLVCSETEWDSNVPF